MLSKPIQQRLRRTASSLLFTAQYHSRMLYLGQRHKIHTSLHPTSEVQTQKNGPKPGMTPPPSTSDIPLSASFQTAKEKFEHVSSASPSPLKKRGQGQAVTGSHPLPTVPGIKRMCDQSSSLASSSIVKPQSAQASSTLPTAKRRTDHLFFVENVPTLPVKLTAPTVSAPAKLPSSTPNNAPLPTSNNVPASSLLAKMAAAWYTGVKWRAALHSYAKLKRVHSHKASLIGAGLVVLMLIALVVQSSLASHTLGPTKTTHVSRAPQRLSSEANKTNQQAQAQQTLAPQQTPAPKQTPAPQQQAPSINASKALVRISQLDPGEYASRREFDIWAYSACSTAAMTEVFNAYGHHYRITDVLRIEARIGAITPDLGLVDSSGVAHTAERFGFKTKWSDSWTLDQVLHSANTGHPVIVDWPPDRYPDGHIVVVTGGDPHRVYLADSSYWNRHWVPRAQFAQWWGGFAAIVTPK